MTLKAVVLCGGSGTRLWPESRKNLPKQFINIIKDKSLLDLTIERIVELKKVKKPLIICNKSHLFLVKNSLDKYKIDADIILEPIGRNTTAAIYLAAKLTDPKDNLIIMPADHLIPDVKNFVEEISFIEKSFDFKSWITLGIKPSFPSSGYGYIKARKNNKNKIYNVDKFIEKPTIKKASEMIKKGNYFWNSGIFIGNSKMIASSINFYAEDIAKACNKVLNKQINNNKNEISFPEKQFSKIPSRSIDYAVMELETNIKLYPLGCDWNDIGSWDAFAGIYNNQKTTTNIIQFESNNNFIRSDKRVIATIGIDNTIIIDNDNSTLVIKKNQSEKVRDIVEEIKKRNLSQTNEHTFEFRPWGKFEVLLNEAKCKVKKLIITPKKRLSLQYHNYRKEHWLVVSGVATVHLSGKLYELYEGMSIDIPTKSNHFIQNNTLNDLIIIETQLGSYFGEDDIIRLDDPYDR